MVGRDEKVNLKLGHLAAHVLVAKWSTGHFGSRSFLYPSICSNPRSPLGPGKMAHQWGDRRGGGQDRNRGWGGDQWTGGRSGGGGGHPGAHNPYEIQLPRFLSTVIQHEDQTDWSSIMMVDKRDDRLVSPFQAWLQGE